MAAGADQQGLETVDERLCGNRLQRERDFVACGAHPIGQDGVLPDQEKGRRGPTLVEALIQVQDRLAGDIAVDHREVDGRQRVAVGWFDGDRLEAGALESADLGVRVGRDSKQDGRSVHCPS